MDPVLCTDGHTYERRAIEAWCARILYLGKSGASVAADLLCAHGLVSGLFLLVMWACGGPFGRCHGWFCWVGDISCL